MYDFLKILHYESLPAMQVICKAKGRTFNSYINFRMFAASCIVIATIPNKLADDEYIFFTASELKSGRTPDKCNT